MRFITIGFIFVFLSTQTLNGMTMTGDKITTKAGTISVSELITIRDSYKTLRNAYIITTSLIIAYLLYEKIYKTENKPWMPDNSIEDLKNPQEMITSRDAH